FRYRMNIYRAAARSRRALQLAETFPVLAFLIYNDVSFARHQEETDRRKEAAALVERGARLREVAAVMELPTALRHIKPGAAHLVNGLCFEQPDLVRAFLPDTLPRVRTWLRASHFAYQRAGHAFAEWAARHVSEIQARSLREVFPLLADLGDWVNACQPPSSSPDPWGGEPEHPGHRFVTRRFMSSMSLKTVVTLSAEWHEAVAQDMDGPKYAFPQPWYAAVQVGGYEIVPIDNSADLYREGATMHHCVGA